jgi:hypothetical protein
MFVSRLTKTLRAISYPRNASSVTARRQEVDQDRSPHELIFRPKSLPWQKMRAASAQKVTTLLGVRPRSLRWYRACTVSGDLPFYRL